MTFGLCYWILMLLWLVFGTLTYWPRGEQRAGFSVAIGGNLVLFVLLVLLGWKVFGPPLHG